MIDLGPDKLYCDRSEWECYNHTPDHVIDEINAIVHAVITTNNDPVVSQKIIYDTLHENGYGKYGFRDSECDACTTRIINLHYGSRIDRWANLDLRAEKKGEKWVKHTINTPKQQHTKTMGLSALSQPKLADALADDVATYIREDERFMELILQLLPEAIHEHLGDLNMDVLAHLTAHLAPKMVLVGMED